MAFPQPRRFGRAALQGRGDPDDNAKTFAELAQWLGTQVKAVEPIRFEPLEAWRRYDGRDMRLAMMKTRRDGIEQMAWFLARTTEDEGFNFLLLGMEVPLETYRQWGGIAHLLALRDIIPSVASMPADERDRVSRADGEAQTAVFEAALNAQFLGLSAQMRASQASTLLRMQELNYDMLLGDDITSPGIAD